MLPHMKGFRNFIDSWREDRNREGWREEGNVWKDVLELYLFEDKISEEGYDMLVYGNEDKNGTPHLVMPVPRLFDDLEVLSALMSEDTPATVPARFSKTAEIIY